MNVHFNYYIGADADIPIDYNYRKRPDPDINGCKKLYDDIIDVYFVDGIITDNNVVKIREQQFRYNAKYDKVKIEELWRRYFALRNAHQHLESSIYKPPFYTIVYKEFLLASDYIGPSIYWAEQKGLERTKIIDILNVCGTIGGHIVWPRGWGKTINQNRGGKENLYDRIDWTLFLVKLFCDNDFDYHKVINTCTDIYGMECKSAIVNVVKSMDVYKKWFREFGDSSSAFVNFCEQFKLKGAFVDDGYNIIWLSLPIPILPDNYFEFANNNIKAIENRNNAIMIAHVERKKENTEEGNI